MSNAGPWPRLTPKQRETLEAFDDSKYGDLRCSSGMWRTTAALVYAGMIGGGSGSWYSITQRGRDYVRFVIRENREKKRIRDKRAAKGKQG